MEVLIAEIQKRNILWNKQNSRYKDRLVIDKEWDYVAESVGFTKDEAKEKWRNLRDRFAKELKKYRNLDQATLLLTVQENGSISRLFSCYKTYLHPEIQKAMYQIEVLLKEFSMMHQP